MARRVTGVRLALAIISAADARNAPGVSLPAPHAVDRLSTGRLRVAEVRNPCRRRGSTRTCGPRIEPGSQRWLVDAGYEDGGSRAAADRGRSLVAWVAAIWAQVGGAFPVHKEPIAGRR